MNSFHWAWPNADDGRVHEDAFGEISGACNNLIAYIAVNTNGWHQMLTLIVGK